MDEIEEFQDLGDLKSTLRRSESVGPSGVESLVPDEGKTFAEAQAAFREVVEEYYGDNLDRLAGEDEEALIERIVVKSDDVPHIEYTVVEEIKDDE